MAQPEFEPAAMERFLGDPRIAVLAYVRKDGRPGQAPIWYVYRDGEFWISSEAGTAKYHALRRDPRVSLTIQDERPPYRAVVVDAVAEFVGPGEPARAGDIDRRYFGRIGAKLYQSKRDEEGRPEPVEIRLRPVGRLGFDNTRIVTRSQLWFIRARPHLPFLRNLL